ncbi:MAG TPA: hypothetical protein VLN49_11250 [Gemmatimonadaceae bacterium]|nr:hypothetical protein [Gemmatimonadaceae bacterium]
MSISRSRTCRDLRRLSWIVPLAILLAACSDRAVHQAAHGSAPSGLVFPMVFDSTCEGEDCEATNFLAAACDSAVLRATRSDSSPVVARVGIDDTVLVLSRSLHVLEPGIVLLRREYTLATDDDGEGPPSPRKDTLHFASGDTLYLIRYLELGSWVWWYGGRLQSGYEFWGGDNDESVAYGGISDDSTNAVRRSVPKIAHWWHVRPRTGREGWWHADPRPALVSLNQMLHWNDNCPSERKSWAAEKG